jgi:nucleoside-diphosphate-sugar epimerase
MRVLVTGASGFLGGHIAETLARHGHAPVALVRSNSPTAFLKTLGVELRQATLDNPPALRRAIQGTDAVVHVAAKVHTHGFWSDFVETTIHGTRHVLEAAIAAGVPHFIQISTVGVYGRLQPGGRPFDETCGYGRPHHWNYYSRAKIEAEKLVRDAQQQGRIATTILRPSWIYGPRDTTTFDRIVTALRAHRYRWIGSANNRLSLIFVTDVANAVLLAATNPKARGQIYNVAADETSPSQRDFISRICDLTGAPPPTSTLTYAAAHQLGFLSECVAHLTRYRVCPPVTRLTALLFGGDRRYNSAKIRAELGWHPAVAADEGIRLTAEWYLKQAKPSP